MTGLGARSWAIGRGAASLSLTMLFVTPSGAQSDVPFWQARDAAMVTASWAIETNNPAVLSDSIRLLLANGGVTDPDAPFSAFEFLVALAAMEGGTDLAEAIRSEQSRGVASGGGALRYDLRLGAAEDHEISLIMAQGEPAIVEVRTYRGSAGADIDLWVYGPEGTLMGEDVGSESGTEGNMAFVEFVPDRCIPVTVRLLNNGSMPARVAVFAPPALGENCER